MHQPHQDCDIAIVGGGLVGASLACALDRLGGRTVALIEAVAAGQAQVRPSFDERNLALAEASLNALAALGVSAHFATGPAAIRRIHVTRSGDFGAVRLSAEDYGRDRFGGVVVARELGAALEARLAELSSLKRYCPARVSALHAEPGGYRIALDGEGAIRTLTARMVIAADGSHSFVRKALGIAALDHDYRQTLFVSTLASSRPPEGQAWERFTETGPLALLPRPDGHYGAIMGVARDQAQRVQTLSDADYLALIQERFGGRAGRFVRVGKRASYPIIRSVAERLDGHRALLMGNAAQTIHPIGAQGFNLGLRDALIYVDALAEAGPSADPGDPRLLAAHVAARREDRARTLAFSDGLARLTANPSSLASGLRSLGLLALSHLPSLRAPLVGGAMGYRGRVPSLARGGE